MPRLLGIAAGIAAVVVLAASPAGATDGTVSYGQTCSMATVTVASSWDGGTIHGVIHGPIPEIVFDVAPLGSTPVTFKIIPSPLTVTVSSSNGHLHGELTHTFTADPCGTPTTAPAPTSTTICNESSPPPNPCAEATTTTTAPPETAPPETATTAPPETAPPETAPPPAVTVRPGPPRTAPPATTPPLLPATGAATNALVALVVATLGLGAWFVYIGRRRRRR